MPTFDRVVPRYGTMAVILRYLPTGTVFVIRLQHSLIHLMILFDCLLVIDYDCPLRVSLPGDLFDGLFDGCCCCSYAFGCYGGGVPIADFPVFRPGGHLFDDG